MNSVKRVSKSNEEANGTGYPIMSQDGSVIIRILQFRTLFYRFEDSKIYREEDYVRARKMIQELNIPKEKGGEIGDF